MREILIFRHAPHEGPGYLAEYLDRRGLAHRLIRIDQNEAVPSSIDGVSGIALMGGPMSVNDNLPWIPKVTRIIQKAVEAEVPVLGHCLGGQLISKALGGTITRNPVKEIGWLPVQRVDHPAANVWFDGLPREFEVFHWHGETFSIPPGAARILASRDCPNQAFAVGKTLALQCHIEMTGAMVREWIEVSDDELDTSCATVQDADTMTVDLEPRVQRMQRLADKIYDRWIQGLA